MAYFEDGSLLPAVNKLDRYESLGRDRPKILNSSRCFKLTSVLIYCPICVNRVIFQLWFFFKEEPKVDFIYMFLEAAEILH